MNIIIQQNDLKSYFDFIINCEFELNNTYLKDYYKKQNKTEITKVIKKHSEDIKYLIAFDENNPIGMLAYTISKEFGKLQINSLFIKNKYRSLGIGKKMIQKIENIAKKEKCKFIRLFVEKLNPKGLKFYKSNDFKITGYKMEKLLN